MHANNTARARVHACCLLLCLTSDTLVKDVYIVLKFLNFIFLQRTYGLNADERSREIIERSSADGKIASSEKNVTACQLKFMV